MNLFFSCSRCCSVLPMERIKSAPCRGAVLKVKEPDLVIDDLAFIVAVFHINAVDKHVMEGLVAVYEVL